MVIVVAAFSMPYMQKAHQMAVKVLDLNSELEGLEHKTIMDCHEYDRIIGELAPVDVALLVEFPDGITSEVIERLIMLQNLLEQGSTVTVNKEEISVSPQKVDSIVSFNNFSFDQKKGLLPGKLLENFDDTTDLDSMVKDWWKNDWLRNRYIYTDQKGKAVESATDLKATLFIVEFSPADNQEGIFVSVNDAVCRSKLGQNCNAQTLNGPTTNVYLHGSIIIDQFIDYMVGTQINTNFPYAGLVMFVLLVILIGWFGTVITLFEVVIALVLTWGLMGVTNTPLNVMTGILPILLLAIGNEYAIHFYFWSIHFYQECEDPKVAISKAIDKVGRVVFYAAGSTAVGFLTLQFTFRIKSIQSFGLWSCVGVTMCMLCTLLLVASATRIYLGSFGGRKLVWLTKRKALIEKAFLFVAKTLNKAVLNKTPRRLLEAIMLATTTFFIVGIFQLRVGSSPQKFFRSTHPLGQANIAFSKYAGGNSSIEMLIDLGIAEQGANPWNKPSVIHKTQEFLNKVKNEKCVAFHSTYLDILSRLYQVVVVEPSANNIETYEKQNNIASIGSKELAAQLLLLYEISSDPDDFYQWIVQDPETPIDPKTGKEMAGYAHYYLKVNIWADLADSAEITKLCQKIKAIADAMGIRVILGGEFVMWGEPFNYYVVFGKVFNIITCLILVYILARVAFGAWRLGVLAIAPLAFTCIVIFGGMGFLGIRLDMASCTVSGIVVFLVVDWNYYLISRLKHNFQTLALSRQVAISNALEYETPPIFIDAITNASAYSVLLRSDFQPLRIFGWLVGMAQAIGSIGTLIITSLLAYEFPWFFIQKKPKAQ